MKTAAAMLVALCAMAQVAVACDLDCAIGRELDQQRLAGAVHARVVDGRVHTGAVGFANHATRQPMRADTRVHIGSVTKTFVALGVLRLATQGRVHLDQPLAELLPGVVLDNPWQARSPVTLRHLLDHTAGLQDLRLWHLFTQRVTPRDPLLGAFARSPGLLRVRSEPGTQFSYSNLGYTLVGLVIEEVTGQRYEAWLDRELLRPLGMEDSTFEFVSQQGPEADPRLAWGHLDDLGVAAALPVWVRPATQMTTTAADMARAATFLMGDGRIADARFVDEALLRQMARARTLAAAAGHPAGYALGLAVRDRHGAAGLCHTGNIIGFRAALCLYPDRGRAYFIAINSDSEAARYPRFDELMTRAVEVATPVAPVVAQVAPRAWEGRYGVEPARFEAFRYFDLLLDSAVLRTRAQGIEWARRGAPPQRLLPVGERLYRAEDRSLASHVLLEEGGRPAVSDDARTWRKIGTAKFVANWVSLALGLAGLAMLFVLIPWRAWRRGEPLLQPAAVALLMLMVSGVLLAVQPFMALGDRTIASVGLYVATGALPVAMLAQGVWAWVIRARLKSWRVHAVAAVLVLQWCGVLYAWDLLPFASWR